VREWKGSVVFLHEVAEGAGGRSWGVHVAKLAGVPAPVLRRAEGLLAALEQRGPLTAGAELPLFAAAGSAAPAPPVAVEPDPLREALAAIDPDRLSPREALESLYRLKATLSVAEEQEGLR
jgi:DNA mismatch repair protein MutS